MGSSGFVVVGQAYLEEFSQGRKWLLTPMTQFSQNYIFVLGSAFTPPSSNSRSIPISSIAEEGILLFYIHVDIGTQPFTA